MADQSTEKYDVVIVGAGPAGCICALYLEPGMRVLLVDRLDLPRDVICGGMLSSAAMEQLTHTELPPFVQSQPETLDWRVYDWRLSRAGSWDGDRYVNVDRKQFDKWLLDQVLARDGLEAWPRTSYVSCLATSGDSLKVCLSRSGRKTIVETRYLVGADGSSSRIRRSFGWPMPGYWAAVQETIKPDEVALDQFLAVLDDDIDFYGWVIPKGERLLIGAGYDGSAGNVMERFMNFRRELARRQGIDGPTVQAARVRPITRLHSTRQIIPGKSNILLAGEAAGFISPWTGEGISYALASGVMAGQALCNHSPIDVYAENLLDLWPRLQKDLMARKLMKRPYRRLLAATVAPQASFKRLKLAS